MMWPTHEMRKRLTRSQLKEASNTLRNAIDVLVDIDDPQDVLRATIEEVMGIESRIYDLYLDHVLPPRPDDEGETA